MSNNSGFLGGAPQFNKAGVGASDDGSPEVVTPTPQGLQPYQIRNAIIVFAILVMLGILFFISDPGGVIHKQGRGGRAMDAKPTVPSNF